VIDARRNEFFYRIDGEDRLAGPEKAVREITAVPVPAVGDGALKLREALEARGTVVPPIEEKVHVVSAVVLLHLAKALEPLDPDDVVPNYIRPPDAKVSSRESWLVGAAK
jgi:tRNA A37 threonylcarbamoyladenosine modification protein TsaB